MNTFVVISIAVVSIAAIFASRVTGNDAAEPDLRPEETVSSRYYDTRTDLSFQAPGGLLVDEIINRLPGEGDGLEASTRVYSTGDGRPVISIASAPNPHGLSTSDWVATFPGWPGENPTEIVIGGITGLKFVHDQAGGANPTVYFRKDGNVIGVRGATDLERAVAALSATEFDTIVESFESVAPLSEAE